MAGAGGAGLRNPDVITRVAWGRMALPTRRRRIAAALCTGALALGLLAFAATQTAVGQHASARVIRWLAGPPERPNQEVVFERQSEQARAAMQAEHAAISTGGEDEGSLAPQGEGGEDDGSSGTDGELLVDETTDNGPPLDLIAEMKRTARPKGLPGVSYLLLLGTDKSHPKLRGRTDAIIVVAFRDRDGAIGAFSVPRDLWVEIPDLKYARINSVARVGDVEYGRGKGIPLLKKMLELELGVRVDHYALVDFAGFRGIVDALGGVDVDVPCPIVDCFWSNGRDQPCVPLDVESGRQRMDGVTALMYARSRHGRGDFDRSRRQQAVIAAIVRKVRAGGLSGTP